MGGTRAMVGWGGGGGGRGGETARVGVGKMQGERSGEVKGQGKVRGKLQGCRSHKCKYSGNRYKGKWKEAQTNKNSNIIHVKLQRTKHNIMQ